MIDDARKEKKERVIAFLKENPFYRHAGWAIGVSEDTLQNWRKEDEDFSARCEASRSENLSKRVRRASDEFILTHADPETFNIAKKIEATGKDGKDLFPQPIVGGLSTKNETPA